MERSFCQSGENPIKQATTSQIWSVVSRRFANHQCRRGYVHYPGARVEVVKLSGRGSNRFQDRNMVLSTDEKRRGVRKELTAEVRDSAGGNYWIGGSMNMNVRATRRNT